MLASGKKILDLIPQRPPIVMVDKLLSCDGQTTVTQLLVRKDNIFLHKDKLSPAGLMESMAQTAAARTGWLLKNRPEGENKRAPIGVIGSIKNFRLHLQPAAGKTITMTVEVQYEIMQATIVSAKVEVEGNLAAEAELKIFLTE
jgi:3-hydroxymyristoyl/3-hydroxydecanoyl-(acyl carrier protein) dehydratase